MKSTQRRLSRRQEYIVYFVLFAVALLFTVVLLPSSDRYFRRFFGPAHPLLVVVLASATGAAALWFLETRYGFAIVKGRATLRGIGMSWVLASLLAVAIVVAALIIRYPEDTNVPVPRRCCFTLPSAWLPRSSSTSCRLRSCCWP